MPHHATKVAKKAIFVRCSDGDWGPGTAEIVDDLLGLNAGERDDVSVAGTVPEIARNKKYGQFLAADLRLLARNHRIAILVLVHHSGCAKLAFLRGGPFPTEEEDHAHGLEVLKAAAKVLRDACRELTWSVAIRALYVHDENHDGVIESDEIAIVI